MAGTMLVEEASVSSRDEFQERVHELRKPCLLKGVDIGHAPLLWTPEYLRERCGEKSVRVHVTPVPQMDFINKNFMYRTLTLGELVSRCSTAVQTEYFISPDEKYYLRSLGDDPRKDAANFSDQYPELANDLTLPMLFESSQFFSSVLRISSPDVQLWTHYDVMDNFLVQVTGKKRVVLFSPRDALNMYLHGDKSAVIDIDHPDTTKYPLFQNAVRYECSMSPGDVLYIPALWFHNVRSLDFSIAVNMFWRHLDACYYDSKDVYGNKDPPQAQRAQQIMERALTSLSELPKEYRDFYGRCLIARMQQKCLNETHDETL